MFKEIVLRGLDSIDSSPRKSGSTKNEKFVVRRLKYPVDEFFAYSDQKITDILKSVGGTHEEIQLAFITFKAMGRRSDQERTSNS